MVNANTQINTKITPFQSEQPLEKKQGPVRYDLQRSCIC